MKRLVFGVVLMILMSPASAFAASAAWNPATLAALKHWAEAAPQDALPTIPASEIDRAVTGGGEAASELALRLARMHLLGSAGAVERTGWRIPDTDSAIDLGARLDEALAAADIDRFFADLQPRHPDYAVLRAAHAAESDPARRATLARNMERWRWMPLSLGQDYVLVNAATFEVSLWQNGSREASWRVIVGKRSTPTPVFTATITGVTFNPWWDVPANIVRESVGALTRRNPALARQRGYVWGGGHYRQRPGPGNSLGRMKLVMPNPFSVYLHDTPNKDLFGRDVRAFSHGCVRVGDALGFAATLLRGIKTREEVDAMVAAGHTVTVDLAASLPVYIAYFTAATDGSGALVIKPDIYGRDGRISLAGDGGEACPA